MIKSFHMKAFALCHNSQVLKKRISFKAWTRLPSSRFSYHSSSWISEKDLHISAPKNLMKFHYLDHLKLILIRYLKPYLPCLQYSSFCTHSAPLIWDHLYVQKWSFNTIFGQCQMWSKYTNFTVFIFGTASL